MFANFRYVTIVICKFVQNAKKINKSLSIITGTNTKVNCRINAKNAAWNLGKSLTKSTIKNIVMSIEKEQDFEEQKKGRIFI